ncbi:MAG: beta-N-acetylhexosaminidase [Bacteroidales bacterium]|nr:beta-N-acetylhexosaminidase [Bacteroidales bacterium]
MGLLRSIVFAAVLVAPLSFSGCRQAEVLTGDFSLVSPLPRSVTEDEAAAPFVISDRTLVCYPEGDGSLRSAADMLSEQLTRATGCRIGTSTRSSGGKRIVLSIDPETGTGLKEFQVSESYRISVGPSEVSVSGGGIQGVLHGIQTLVKALAVPEVAGSYRFALPAGAVADYPEFPYRAFMLDCGRHFFPAAYIKQLIDILALHNINYFHWHLSEDQGWRLEIKKYPRLTEVGSYRPGTSYDSSGKVDDVPVSGFYTQDEAREIVRYAAERGITVIPEIDMPGHTMAALAAYPELGCTGGPYEVATRYGVLDDVLCVGKDGTMTFVKDVLEEVLDIFPSEYIHIGGDECPKIRWAECPDCQRKIRELGLKGSGSKTGEELLQSWFTSEIEAFLAARGRRMICWNDVLCDWGDQVVGEPSKNTVIAGWMRPASVAVAAREGYDAIMCPVGHLYFSNAANNKLTGLDLIRTVYDLPVIPEGLTAEEKNHIIGAEACIWTERVAETDSLEWRLLPRLSTLAELQWSDPEAHDLDAYIPRLRHMTELYLSRGWNTRKDILPPKE